MIKYILGFLIFCIVLFFYIHIYYHLKRENDLEIYTIEMPSKDRLEEICNLKQPVMFNFENENIVENCSFEGIKEKYAAFDIKVRNTKEEKDDTPYLPLPLKESENLFLNDKEGKYFTERNEDFLNETGVIKRFRYNDTFLRPPLVSNCKYDIWSGSENTCTPLRYFLNFRNYFYVTHGSVKVQLIAPKNDKYLYVEKDYDNFEFYSPVNNWNVQEKYRTEFQKVNVLEIELEEGNILFIPPYWWFSIKFGLNSSISVFKYRTYMNTVAILPEICMSLLQNQNIKHETESKLSFVEKAAASVEHMLASKKE